MIRIVCYGSLLLVFLFTSFSTFVFHRNRIRKIIEKSESNIYRVLSFDKKSSIFNVGFVSMSDNIEENEYFSIDGKDNQFLISNFGEQEYRCAGTCYCDEGRQILSNRRSVSVGLHVTLSYLLVAVSSYTAYEKAKEYFEEKCDEESIQGCSQHAIRSEVNDCYHVIGGGEDHGRFKIVPNIDNRKFVCWGNCVPNRRLYQSEIAKNLVEKYDCKALRAQKEIVVDCTNVRKFQGCNYKARLEFQKELTVFCKENSRERYYYQRPGDNNGGYWVPCSVCVGQHKHAGVSRHIQCNQIYPKFRLD